MDSAGRAAYEALYPIGKIPLLKPKPDHMVPESTIIVEYLEGHHPGGTQLIPDGIDAARQVRFMDRMSDFYLNDPVANLQLAFPYLASLRDGKALNYNGKESYRATHLDGISRRRQMISAGQVIISSRRPPIRCWWCLHSARSTQPRILLM